MITFRQFTYLFSILTIITLMVPVPAVVGMDLTKYTKSDPLTGYLCGQNPLINYPGGTTRLLCATLCSIDTLCSSFFWNTQTLDCKGVGVTYMTTAGCNSNPGFLYYSDADAVDLEAIPCNSNNQCPQGNYQCSSENYCQCKPGYSLTPSTGTCTDGCTVYGNTFSVYRDQDMTCGGSFHTDVNEQQSLDLCFPEDCVAVSFNQNINACKIRQCTPLQEPLTSFQGVHSYVRNCV